MDTERHEKHEYSCKCRDCSLFKVEKLLIENARLRAELKTFQDPEYAGRLKDLTERAAESGKLLRENRELRAGLPLEECPACKLKTRHTAAEYAEWHPYAGKGFSKEHGTPPEEERNER